VSEESGEISAEATAAGVAAAAAVEEIQSREALTDEVETAAIDASVALGQADTAVQIAAHAEERTETAVEASQAAIETSAVTAEVAYATAAQLEEIAANQARIESALGDMRSYIDSRIPAVSEEPTGPEFEEVEVTNGGIRNSGGADGSESGETGSAEAGAESESHGEPSQKNRRKLRHRR
jgi:hypothetical protein